MILHTFLRVTIVLHLEQFNVKYQGIISQMVCRYIKK